MMWKMTGQAASAAEHELEAILARVRRWEGAALRYRPVSGGISNPNWRISLGEGPDYFLKVPGRGTEMFIRRDAANDASRRAFECGFGVEVVDFLPEDGVEIFAFMEGWRATSNLDFLRPAVRGNAITALRAFNDSAPLKLTKTIFDMLEEHFIQLKMVHAREPADMAFLKRCFTEAKAALLASGLDLVPCMNDTLAGNFMIDDADNILLVDFEYASNNDRAYEFALWLTEMAFPETVEHEMMEIYFGQADRRTEARVAVLKALADFKWASWAMIQDAVSDLDFDYYKYGGWKYMRARTVFHHPDWQRWLRAL